MSREKKKTVGKTTDLHIRLTDTEKKELRKRVKAMKVTISEFVRRAIFDDRSMRN